MTECPKNFAGISNLPKTAEMRSTTKGDPMGTCGYSMGQSKNLGKNGTKKNMEPKQLPYPMGKSSSSRHFPNLPLPGI